MTIEEQLRIEIWNLTAELNLARAKKGLALAERDQARAETKRVIAEADVKVKALRGKLGLNEVFELEVTTIK